MVCVAKEVDLVKESLPSIVDCEDPVANLQLVHLLLAIWRLNRCIFREASRWAVVLQIVKDPLICVSRWHAFANASFEINAWKSKTKLHGFTNVLPLQVGNDGTAHAKDEAGTSSHIGRISQHVIVALEPATGNTGLHLQGAIHVKTKIPVEAHFINVGGPEEAGVSMPTIETTS